MSRHAITIGALVALQLVSGCADSPSAKSNVPRSPKLLVELPVEFNTPDGADVDAEGNILSIPSFNNDHLLQTGAIEEPAPPAMAKIDKNNVVTTWYTFTANDMHPDTVQIGPINNALGPDGNLDVADNQSFWAQDHRSRLPRINIDNGVPIGVDIVVTGLIVANGPGLILVGEGF